MMMNQGTIFAKQHVAGVRFPAAAKQSQAVEVSGRRLPGEFVVITQINMRVNLHRII